MGLPATANFLAAFPGISGHFSSQPTPPAAPPSAQPP